MNAGSAVLVPLKSTGRGKSRLGLPDPARMVLARSMARDTVGAVRAATGVALVRVVVETADDAMLFAADEVLRVDDIGLNEAIGAAGAVLADQGWRGPVAVLTADLPFLRPAELSAVLRAAAGSAAVVPDAAGTGTSALLAESVTTLRPAFGANSRARHVANGHRELDVAVTSGIRRDIDVLADLGLPADLPLLGPHTAGAIRRLAADGLLPAEFLQVTVLP